MALATTPGNELVTKQNIHRMLVGGFQVMWDSLCITICLVIIKTKVTVSSESSHNHRYHSFPSSPTLNCFALSFYLTFLNTHCTITRYCPLSCPFLAPISIPLFNYQIFSLLQPVLLTTFHCHLMLDYSELSSLPAYPLLATIHP
jgi:hypothetical protein